MKVLQKLLPSREGAVISHQWVVALLSSYSSDNPCCSEVHCSAFGCHSLITYFYLCENKHNPNFGLLDTHNIENLPHSYNTYIMSVIYNTPYPLSLSDPVFTLFLFHLISFLLRPQGGGLLFTSQWTPNFEIWLLDHLWKHHAYVAPLLCVRVQTARDWGCCLSSCPLYELIWPETFALLGAQCDVIQADTSWRPYPCWL